MATCTIITRLVNLIQDGASAGATYSSDASATQSILQYQFLDRWTVSPNDFYAHRLRTALHRDVISNLSNDQKSWKIDLEIPDEAFLVHFFGEISPGYFDSDSVDHGLFFDFVVRQCFMLARDLLRWGDFLDVNLKYVSVGRLTLIVEGEIHGATSALPPDFRLSGGRDKA